MAKNHNGEYMDAQFRWMWCPRSRKNIYGLDPVDLDREGMRPMPDIESMKCGGIHLLVGDCGERDGMTFYRH